MFSSAAHSAVYFARRTVFATLCKQARFLSVSAVSSTKKFYSESVLFYEKPSKSAYAKKSNDKKLEQSQLYPDEMEKPEEYNFEEFNLLMDDKTPSIQKEERSGTLESVARKSEAVDKIPSSQSMQRSISPESVARKSEAVDKMPSSQSVQGSVWPESMAIKSEAIDKIPSSQSMQRSISPESVARKSEAVDKMPSSQSVQGSVWPESMAIKSEATDKIPLSQSMQGSVWPESIARKSEAVEGLKISEVIEIDLQKNDLGEKLSDSDSEGEGEDYYNMRKRVPNNFQINLNNLKITKLGRRSRFLRENMEMALSQRDKLILNDEISGIFALARLGITPETLFLCSSGVLKNFPADLSNTDLYLVPFPDIKYWSLRVKAPESAMIGVYRKEDFKLNTHYSEPEMPLTIICDQIWHKLGFAQILSSACASPPKLFITSLECVYPWHGAIVRNGLENGILFNHDLGLTWEDIPQKVDEKDRVYLLELSLFREEGGDGTESNWSSLPSVYLYDHNFWDSGNITLIVTRAHGKKVPEELSKFCSERNASRIDVGLRNIPFSLATFHMVYFELRRQWLAAESRNLSESGSKSGKTDKSRVRIVSTLFKT